MEQGTLGKRIAYHRKRLGMTQEQLAQRVGVSAQAVSKWENNLSCPDITILRGATEAVSRENYGAAAGWLRRGRINYCFRRVYYYGKHNYLCKGFSEGA